MLVPVGSQIEEFIRSESSRADTAEAMLREKDEFLSAVRQEMEEMRAVGKVHQEVAADATRRARQFEGMQRDLREELDEAELRAREKERELSDMQGAMRRKSTSGFTQGDSQSSVGERDSGDAGYDQELRRLQAAEEAARRELQAEKDRSSGLASQVDTATMECEQLKVQLLAQQDEQAKLRSNERILRQQEQVLKEQTQQLKSAHRSEQLKVSEGLQRLDSMQRHADSLGDQLQESQQEVRGLQSELSASQERAAQLTQRLRQSEEDLGACRKELSDLQAAKEEQLKAMQVELGSFKAKLADREEELKRAQDATRQVEVAFDSYKRHFGTSDSEQLNRIGDLEIEVDRLKSSCDTMSAQLGEQQYSSTNTQARIRSLESQLSASELQRRESHNIIQDLKGNIRVFCRVRPSTHGVELSLMNAEGNRLNLQHAGDAYPFGFDRVFGPMSGQEDIFDEVSGLVQSALDGYKVCVFAYGQTGSGKTYTMLGLDNPASWGLIPRSMSKVLQSANVMRAAGWSWCLYASFMEVYNENIRDLLRHGGGDTAAGPSVGHVIKHHEAWGTMVTNITSVEVNSMEQIDLLMARAARQRAVGFTDSNAASSRSHSVFALYLRGTNAALNTELHGALHLVDLAGSERLDKSGSQGDRLKETQSINKSLSSLVDVFTAKAEQRAHVPFRNSKLTYLMEPCLSGHGKTLMLVNVRPEASNSHESLCSLRFAKQVSQCDTGGKPKRAAKSISVSGGPGMLGGPRREASTSPAPKRPQPSPEPRRAGSVGRSPRSGSVGCSPRGSQLRAASPLQQPYTRRTRSPTCR